MRHAAEPRSRSCDRSDSADRLGPLPSTCARRPPTRHAPRRPARPAGIDRPSSGRRRCGASALIIFIECWLFPFLPGDSLLFLVGLLISQQRADHGRRSGSRASCSRSRRSRATSSATASATRPVRRSSSKPDSRFFKQEYIDKTFAFFDKYGNRAIVLARFVPIVRTFITLAAGVGRMPMPRFVTYSAIGGVLWATGVTLLGLLAGPGRLHRRPHRLCCWSWSCCLGDPDRDRGAAGAVDQA